jgi:hypothetical protein
MLPDRPLLLPGLAVLRRDRRHLQVGVEPPRCVVLPDEPDVHRLLGDLRAGRPPSPTTTEGHRSVARLVAAGLVADLDTLDGQAAARARVRVGLDAPGDLVHPVTERLGAAGLAVAAPDQAPDVLLVLRDGPVPRLRLDRCAREDLPHLVVSSEPGAVTVGPFVSPGRSACVRCVDAHLGTLDPRRALLLEQVEVAVPREPALHAVALAWAVADLVAWAEGRTPSSWSATVRLDADLDVRRTAWRRHAGCGCAWDEVLTG